MNHAYREFASPDQIQRWRTFSLFNGWSVQHSVATSPGEIRLFDAPIAMYPLASLFAPQFRMIGVGYVPALADPTSSAPPKGVHVNNGQLYATDRRFILRGNSAHKDVSIPYFSIRGVQYHEGTLGLRHFGLEIDCDEIIVDLVEAMPKPPVPFGMSEREYIDRFMKPLFLEASDHAMIGVTISVKAPKAGFFDAAAILGAHGPLNRAWHTYLAQQQNAAGDEFIRAFFLFLNEIADTNRFR